MHAAQLCYIACSCVCFFLPAIVITVFAYSEAPPKLGLKVNSVHCPGQNQDYQSGTDEIQVGAFQEDEVWGVPVMHTYETEIVLVKEGELKKMDPEKYGIMNYGIFSPHEDLHVVITEHDILFDDYGSVTLPSTMLGDFFNAMLAPDGPETITIEVFSEIHENNPAAEIARSMKEFFAEIEKLESLTGFTDVVGGQLCLSALDIATLGKSKALASAMEGLDTVNKLDTAIGYAQEYVSEEAPDTEVIVPKPLLGVARAFDEFNSLLEVCPSKVIDWGINLFGGLPDDGAAPAFYQAELTFHLQQVNWIDVHPNVTSTFLWFWFCALCCWPTIVTIIICCHCCTKRSQPCDKEPRV